MHPKNSTTQSVAQLLATTDRQRFSGCFVSDGTSSVAESLNIASSLLAAGIAVMDQLSAVAPLDESVSHGVSFIFDAAKAMLDSTLLSVELAEDCAPRFSESENVARITLAEFAKGRQAEAGRHLGVSQVSIGKAIRVGRQIYVTDHHDGTFSAVEEKAFPGPRDRTEVAQ